MDNQVIPSYLNVFSCFIPRGDIKKDNTREPYRDSFIKAIPLKYLSGAPLLLQDFGLYAEELGIQLSEGLLEEYITTRLLSTVLKYRVLIKEDEPVDWKDQVQVYEHYFNLQAVLRAVYQDLKKREDKLDTYEDEMHAFLNLALMSNTEMLFDKLKKKEIEYDMFLSDLNLLSTIFSPSKALGRLTRKKVDDQDIVTFSTVDQIDKVLNGGLRRTKLLGWESGAGMGKTKTTVGFWVANALLLKQNVCYISLEQPHGDIEAMVDSCLLNVDTSFLLMPTRAEAKKLNEIKKTPRYVARTTETLLRSLPGRLGSLTVIDSESEVQIYADTLNQNLRNIDKAYGPFDLYVIDYMGILPLSPSVKNVSEYYNATVGYKQFKDFTRSAGKAGIAVGQLNTTGYAKAKKNLPIEQSDVQGGNAAHRNCDYNMAITYTDEMKLDGIITIRDAKVRYNEKANGVEVRFMFSKNCIAEVEETRVRLSEVHDLDEMSYESSTVSNQRFLTEIRDRVEQSFSRLSNDYYFNIDGFRMEDDTNDDNS